MTTTDAEQTLSEEETQRQQDDALARLVALQQEADEAAAVATVKYDAVRRQLVACRDLPTPVPLAAICSALGVTQEAVVKRVRKARKEMAAVEAKREEAAKAAAEGA